MKKIYFATHNSSKLKEISEIAKDYTVIGLDELDIVEEIEETGSTYEENAYIKAKYLYDLLKKPVFSDDSGLSVESLNGEPGVYSARYFIEGDEEANNFHLLQNMLKSSNPKNRNAKYITCICYINEFGLPSYYRGEIEGTIGYEFKGDNGFAYDCLFIPKKNNPEGKTYAELTLEEKNSFSHRKIAFTNFVKNI